MEFPMDGLAVYLGPIEKENLIAIIAIDHLSHYVFKDIKNALAQNL